MTNLSALANPWTAELPVYEPGKPLEEVAAELGLSSTREIAKLASNENAIGPSPRAVEAMRIAAARMHVYPDGDALYLRRALAEKLGVPVREIVLGNGSNELIELLGHVFLHPEASVVVSERAFLIYKFVAALFRARVVEVPMRDMTHDLRAMREAVRPDTRLIFVGNPNNPTGTMVEEADLEALVTGVPEHVVVALDEAYIELLPPERQPDTLRYVRESRNVFVLRTFSKTYGLAGLRIGYAVAPREGAELLHQVRQPFNVNAMAQAAAMAALEDEEHVQRTRKLVAEGLRYLSRTLEPLGLSCAPSVTNFMLVRVGDGRRAYQQLLRRHKVIVRPMDAYGLPEYIRVTIGTRPENERVAKALQAFTNEEND